MSSLSRFSVSLDTSLLRKFDSKIDAQGYPTRSKAIADLMRESLVQEEWKTGKEVAAAIILVYDHHKRGLSDELNEIQHHMGKCIVSTMHIHLDHDNCLEVIIVRGDAKKVKQLVDRLIGLKGVKHGRFVMTTTGKGMS